MTDETQAEKPVHGNGVADAASRIASLLDDDGNTQPDEPTPETEEDAPQQAASDEPEQEEEADESEEAETEEETEESEDEADSEEEEQAEEPAIQPPASMTDAEKQAFTELPRAAQEFLINREKSLTADYTRKTQEIADNRKKVQSESEAAAQERRYYRDGLQILGQQLKQAVEGISDEELKKLEESDPVQWARANETRRQGRERLQAIQQELARVNHTEQQRIAKERQEFLERNRQKLPELIPEWRDQTKATSEKRELGEYLVKSAGFSPEEVQEAADARMVSMARKAMLYDRLQQSKPAVTKKVREAPKPVKPNAAQPKVNEAEQEWKRQRSRLSKTGKVQDAARLIETML